MSLGARGICRCNSVFRDRFPGRQTNNTIEPSLEPESGTDIMWPSGRPPPTHHLASSSSNSLLVQLHLINATYADSLMCRVKKGKVAKPSAAPGGAAPPRRRGRPAIDWTRSRKRRLLRLYLCTPEAELSLKKILEILAEGPFQPK